MVFILGSSFLNLYRDQLFNCFCTKTVYRVLKSSSHFFFFFFLSHSLACGVKCSHSFIQSLSPSLSLCFFVCFVFKSDVIFLIFSMNVAVLSKIVFARFSLYNLSLHWFNKLSILSTVLLSLFRLCCNLIQRMARTHKTCPQLPRCNLYVSLTCTFMYTLSKQTTTDLSCRNMKAKCHWNALCLSVSF